MNPNTTLVQLLKACETDDRTLAIATLEDLKRWIAKGGFLPHVSAMTNGSYRIHTGGLHTRMSVKRTA